MTGASSWQGRGMKGEGKEGTKRREGDEGDELAPREQN